VSNATLVMSAPSVRLWWPAGAGEQPLYNLTVAINIGSARTDISQHGDGHIHSRPGAGGDGHDDRRASKGGDAYATVSTMRQIGFRHAVRV
jgi:hypothetical protein